MQQDTVGHALAIVSALYAIVGDRYGCRLFVNAPAVAHLRLTHSEAGTRLQLCAGY